MVEKRTVRAEKQHVAFAATGRAYPGVGAWVRGRSADGCGWIVGWMSPQQGSLKCGASRGAFCLGPGSGFEGRRKRWRTRDNCKMMAFLFSGRNWR